MTQLPLLPDDAARAQIAGGWRIGVLTQLLVVPTTLPLLVHGTRALPRAPSHAAHTLCTVSRLRLQPLLGVTSVRAVVVVILRMGVTIVLL